MAITVDRRDDLKASVFHAQGDIDLAVVPELRATLQALLDTGIANVVFDMTEVVYADSSALGLLVWLDRELQQRDGKVVLAGASRDVRRIIEMAGLAIVAPTLHESPSLETALGELEPGQEAVEPLWAEEIEMMPDVGNLAAVREHVAAMIEPLRFDDAMRFDIKVALGEALANAIRHGCSTDGGRIGIRVTAYDDRVTLEVTDSGAGFDGQHVCSDDLYASGGRGIMFMRALMDQVTFCTGADGGTTVKLVKHRTATAPG